MIPTYVKLCPLFWNLRDGAGEWHTLRADLASLYDHAMGTPGAYDSLGIDKLLVAVGAWNNKEIGSHSAALFDDILITGTLDPVESLNNSDFLPTDESVFENEFGQVLIEREAERRRKMQAQ